MTKVENNINKIITFSLLLIWTLMIAFSVFSYLKPNWLVKLSDPGKNVEAISKKKAADILLKNNQFVQAISLYQSALKIKPDYNAAIANMAIAFQKTGHYQNAFKAFRSLLENNPEKPDIVYYNMAEVVEKNKMIDKAIEYYLISAELSPFPENAYRKAGKLKMDRNNWEEAFNLFELSYSHRLTLRNAYLGMYKTLQQSSRDTISIDEEIFNNLQFIYDETSFITIQKSDKNLISTINNMGFCKAKNGEYAAAIDYFNLALNLNPRFKDARNNKIAVKALMN